jgi:hypothetical protein
MGMRLFYDTSLRFFFWVDAGGERWGFACVFGRGFGKVRVLRGGLVVSLWCLVWWTWWVSCHFFAEEKYASFLTLFLVGHGGELLQSTQTIGRIVSLFADNWIWCGERVDGSPIDPWNSWNLRKGWFFMHEVIVGLGYIAMVIAPCLVAARTGIVWVDD